MPEQQVDLDLGKVVGDPGASLRFRDAWNSGSEYRNDATYIDVVQHNGSLWVCKQTNTGQTPSSSSEYWGLGAQGIRQAGEMLQGRLLYLSANGMDTSTVSNADLEELVQANVPEKIGTLSDLKTSAKGNLVAAVNELNGKITASGGVVKIGGVVILQRGVTPVTLSTSEQDFVINFHEDFLDWPSVVFSVQRSGYASQTHAVLKSRGVQGFTITAASGANSNLAVTISWIAMYTPD